MTYVAADDRYDRMQYRKSGRWGLKLPAISLGLWHNFGGDRPLERSRAILRRAFDLWRDAFRPREQLRAAVRRGREELRLDPHAGLPPLPRRARHLDEGGLRHVAGAVRGVGVAQVPARLARPVACSAWGSTTSTSSTRTASTPTRRSRRRWARCTRAVQRGKALYAGHLVVLRREDARGGRHPARPRHTAAHPPAVVLAAQPVDRAGRCSTRSRRSAPAASPSRRSPRACSPTSTSTGSPRARGRRRTPRSRPTC